MQKYNPKEIESKYIQKWREQKLFKTPEISVGEKKYYSLYSFPYPSGSGLHVGHAEGMVANDIMARYYRMKGHKVLFPMGWDSFGLPAENFAIKTGTPPHESTEGAIKNFIEQIDRLGISVDWEKELGTHRPDYYKWTQWIFLELFKRGLAYQKSAPVNWCPSCNTVLANEQVVDGKCERCDTEVIQKEMEQWFFKITDYAQRLDDDLAKIDWPNGTKQQQRNWIGRSEGTRVKFAFKFENSFNYSNQNFDSQLVEDKESVEKLIENNNVLLGMEKEEVRSIRKARVEDAEQIASIRMKGWLDNNVDESTGFTTEILNKIGFVYPPSDEQVTFSRSFIEKGAEIYVYAEGDNVLGFIGVEYHKDQNAYEFLVYVHQDYRGQGIGTTLVKYLLDEKYPRDQFQIEVAKSNKNAIKLYKRLGFEIVGETFFERPEKTDKKLPLFKMIRKAPLSKGEWVGVRSHSLGSIEIFTTRIDTIFGATFLVVAPEHKILEQLKGKIVNWSEVEKYVLDAKNKTDLERQTQKEKTGVKINGVSAINPFNDQEVPIYIADYVLGGYGTGAIMAVPAHDERDYEFAKKYGIPVQEVIAKINAEKKENEIFTEYGRLHNSGEYTGMESSQATQKMQEWLEENRVGKKETTYRLRDWLVSRQRYWGAPIPILFSPKAKEEGYGYIPKEKLNILVLHGFGSYGRKGWRVSFEKEMIKLGHRVFIPDLPNPELPEFSEWMSYVESNFSELLSRGEKLVIVGHSLGGLLALKLAEKHKFAKIVAVAPAAPVVDKSIPTEAYPTQQLQAWEKIVNETKDVKFNNIKENIDEVVILNSADDPLVAKMSQGFWREGLADSAYFVDFEDKGHFGSRDIGDKFDELNYFVNLKNNSVSPGVFPVFESELPVQLPTDVDFKPTGESPIKLSKTFNQGVKCPIFGTEAYREADTMDTFVDSSWYFLRYADVDNESEAFSFESSNFWQPADIYMIGAEHTVLHLLYSRFFTKFFFDCGYISFDEPFPKMRHMGLILGPDTRKMSKRWGNVINPLDEIEKYSSDALRMYEMFMGPYEDSKPWNDRAENGVFRFLSRVNDMSEKVKKDFDSAQQRIEINELIAKISKDIENLSYNTAVAKFMEFANFLQKESVIDQHVFETYLKLMAPFAPFLTEHLWETLGNQESIHISNWPEYNSSLQKVEEIKIAVQVNGKVRATVILEKPMSEEEILELAKSDPQVAKYLTGEIKKSIYVQGKLLSLVV